MLIKKNIIALVLAAGEGKRCKTDDLLPKQYSQAAGQTHTILTKTLKKLMNNSIIDYIKVIINKNHESLYQNNIKNINNSKLLPPTFGGKRRQDSVYLGLKSIDTLNVNYVIIHDVCRPFFSNKILNQSIKLLDKYDGVIPVIPVTDSINMIQNNMVIDNIDRNTVKFVQTPQVFKYNVLYQCHELIQKNNPLLEFTDDSAMLIDQGYKVFAIHGSNKNLKITTKEDFKYMITTPLYRTGIGFDVHKFTEHTITSNMITICGTQIPYEKDVIAHSDGDVGIHALVDAILGAIGCGDIGEHFPNTENKWHNMDSSYFLKFAQNKACDNGYIISNIDIIIICEKPKILPYKLKMKENLSQILQISPQLINIKATTTETLGYLGREEGIAAYATVLLYKSTSFE